MFTTPQTCMESFVAALIRKDIDATLPLLTDNVALFYSNGSAIWGKDAFTAAITANWKQLDRYTALCPSRCIHVAIHSLAHRFSSRSLHLREANLPSVVRASAPETACNGYRAALGGTHSLHCPTSQRRCAPITTVVVIRAIRPGPETLELRRLRLVVGMAPHCTKVDDG